MDPDRSPSCIRELTDAAKNAVAIDGLWFLAVEKKYGMEAAIACDTGVLEQFPAMEARRIKERLSLPENGGLDALETALASRILSLVNEYEIRREGPGALVYLVKTCRTQAARNRKGLPPFPCKPVGIAENRSFARAIDPRITVTCISCPPDHPSGSFSCGWRFTMME